MDDLENKTIANTPGSKLRTLLVIATIMLVTVFFAACSSEGKDEPSANDGNLSGTIPVYEEKVETEPEDLPPVQVTMPEYELTYSGDLKDIIIAKELQGQDESGLDFSVRLSESEVPIFTLYYNTDQGDLVTVLTDASGNRIPVAFRMATIPEELSEEDKLMFYTAQEAVNEIIASIVLK